MAREQRLKGIFLVGAAACLWGSFSVTSKFVYELGDTPPVVIGFYRLLLASSVLLLARILSSGWAGLKVAKSDRWALGFIGVSIALYQALFLGAVASIGVILSSLIALCSAPVLVSLLAAVFLRERITAITALAVVTAAVGVFLLVGWPSDPEKGGPSLIAGLAMASGAALCYAVFALASWTLAPRYHPFTLVGLGFGLGAVLLLPMAAHAGLAVSGGLVAWTSILYIGLVATALAYVLFYFGLNWVLPSATGILVLLEPLTSSLLANVLFGEALGPFGIVGAGLLLLATFLTSLRRRSET